MKLTLAEARRQLYDAVVPDLDSQENIDRFDRAINFACERLINSGSWLGMFDHVAFLVPEGDHHITLPPEYTSVEAMAYERSGENGCVCRTPVIIRNQWMALLSTGAFLWDWSQWGSYGFQAFQSYANDRGDGFVTFRDSPYATYRLRFELDSPDDAGKEVLIKGYDGDGNAIFSPSSSCSYQGATYQMAYPDVTTSEVFSKQIYFLHKFSCFTGYLKLYAVNTVDGEETLIGQYEPSLINPDYKRYSIPNCNWNGSFTVRTICKRRYVPMVADTDSVIPANFGALRTAITSIIYEQQNDPGRRDIEFQRALDLLNDELRSSRGGAALTMNINPAAFQLGNLWVGY